MAEGMILIEVCDANEACVPDLFALESEYVDVSVLENACMSECDLCITSPYVFFNGELLQANSAQALLQMIRQRLEEEQSNHQDMLT
ncbi:MAG: YuzB family protein [Alicyclobacillus sp.]|nr:YuzB family protein [Alicyclobacillus sp.]